MGYENRDYYRDDEPPGGEFTLRGAPCYKVLVIVMIAIFLIDVILSAILRFDPFFQYLAFDSSKIFLGQIWRFWSYGFLHLEPGHLLFNMIGLWFLGKIVEASYGPKDLLWIFLSGTFFGGVMTIIIEQSTGRHISLVIGASAGVLAIFMVLVMQNPRASFLFMGMFPIEARWLLAITVMLDMIPVFQALNGTGAFGGIANGAHLGGVAFGFLFYKLPWNPLRSWTSSIPSWKSVKRSVGLGPRLRVVRDEADEDQAFRDKVDTILEKIQRDGEASLTKGERKILIEASKRF